MTIHVINIFTKLLLSYINHVIYFVLTNPFVIQGFDNVQNIFWNTKGNKEDLNSTLVMYEDFIPRSAGYGSENLVLSLQEDHPFGTPNRLLSTAPRERITVKNLRMPALLFRWKPTN